MFSFIKKIQELLGRLRNNKGLWFTTLTLASISGIGVFMFLITSMTSDVKIDVFNSISKQNNQSSDLILEDKKVLFVNMAKAILSNEAIVEDVKLNNIDNLEQQQNNFAKIFKNKNKNNLTVNFYSILNSQAINRDTITNLLKSKSELFGIETQSDGIFLTYISPILDNGNFIGLIEIKELLHSLQENYKNKDQFFVFILHKKMLGKLSLKAKSGKFKEINKNYLVKTGFYKSSFYSSLIDLNEVEFELALKNKYDEDDKYFRSYKNVTDINGVDIGLFVFGEKIENNNGFVQLADNMIKSVTYVSLGLVISILLFMF